MSTADPRPVDDEPWRNRAHLCVKPQDAHASPNTHQQGQRGLSGTTAGGMRGDGGQTGAANGGASPVERPGCSSGANRWGPGARLHEEFTPTPRSPRYREPGMRVTSFRVTSIRSMDTVAMTEP